MKALLTVMFTLTGLLISCGAEASDLSGSSQTKDSVIKGVEVSLESVLVKKVAHGPAVTAVVTEITMKYMQACSSSHQAFAYTTSAETNGVLNLYVLELQSEVILEEGEASCLGLYIAKKTIEVPGIFDIDDINLVNLEVTEALMPKHFSGVYFTELHNLKTQPLGLGTKLVGQVALGCIDKLATIAISTPKSIEMSDDIEVAVAPLAFRHVDTPRVFCAAPNIENFSVLIPGVEKDLSDIHLNYLSHDGK